MGGIHTFTAGRLAESIMHRDISAVEAVTAYLDRISLYNGKVNALVTLNEDQALARASQADEALARGESWGPLHGVPITIKDSIETAGLRTTAGFPPLKDHVPTDDATAVARLKAAGAIILGKTNLSTLTIDCRSENPVFGTTNNPWDLRMTAGGSSCGSAAAVAAGFTPLDLGSDAGGSIRIPAHFCGVYGFKPTCQRVSLAGHIPDLPGKVRTQRLTPVIGPIAGSVADLYLAFRLIAGADGRDFDVPPVPVRDPCKVKDPKGLRIAWSPTLPGIPASIETQDAISGFANKLGNLGCRVEESCPRLDYDGIWDAFWEFQGMVFVLARHFNGLQETLQEPEYTPTILDRMANLQKRDGYINTVEAFFDDHDVLMLPAVMMPAFPHYESGTMVPLDGGMVDSGRVNNHCCLFNYTGQPAVVIPLTKSSGGLPIGLQLVGRRWHDEELLSIAGFLADTIGGIGSPEGFE